MKESGITRLFILVCVAVLLGAYGVGLGVRKIRFAGVEAKASAAAKTKKPAEKPDSETEGVAAKDAAASEPSEEVAAEPSQQADGESTTRPERPGGRRMGGGGMRERFQNMSEEERREAMARMRERSGGRMRGEGGGRGGAFSQMSDEDRENFRAEMEALNDRADEMSEDEMRQARTEIFEKYGVTPRGGGGGRRSGGAEGTPPPKGRACFLPQTPVWVDGELVPIANVTAGRTIGRRPGGMFSLEQVQEHNGTFECRDIALESGDTISVVDAHCFMLDSGKWIAAQNLKSGLRLKTLTSTVGVKSVTRRAIPYTGKVYNLKVRNSDRYLVGRDVIIVRDY